MKFVKMHGLGNDFVFFGGEDARRVEANDPAALAQKLCRKHFGVCADGLVLILPSASCDARMRIFNPDGSEAEMCGNALRCVGKYLYETGAVQSDCMSVETLGGIKPLRVSVEHGRVASVAADMGEARLGETVKIDLGGRETSFLTVDMGNPHAVTYDLFPGDVEFEHFGPWWSATPTSPTAPTWSSAARCRPRGRRCASGSAARGRRWPAAPAPRRPSRRACIWAICAKRRK